MIIFLLVVAYCRSIYGIWGVADLGYGHAL